MHWLEGTGTAQAHLVGATCTATSAVFLWLAAAAACRSRGGEILQRAPACLLPRTSRSGLALSSIGRCSVLLCCRVRFLPRDAVSNRVTASPSPRRHAESDARPIGRRRRHPLASSAAVGAAKCAGQVTTTSLPAPIFAYGRSGTRDQRAAASCECYFAKATDLGPMTRKRCDDGWVILFLGY